jgi:hypothetical protein
MLQIVENERAVLMSNRVPIYAISSWSSMIDLRVAFYVDPIRDIYEVGFLLLSLRIWLTNSGFYNLHVLPTPY